MSIAMRRRLVALTVVALCGFITASPASAGKPSTGGAKGKTKPPATTVGTPEGTFACRAALARLEGKGVLAGVDAEVDVANDKGHPCETDGSGLLLNSETSLGTHEGGTTTLLSADLKVLYGTTHLLRDSKNDLPRKAVAEAGVSLLKLEVLGNTVEVAILTSDAEANCAAGMPVLTGRSKVIGLSVNGVPRDHDLVEVTFGSHAHITLFASLLVSADVKLSFGHLYSATQLDAMLSEGVTIHFNHQDQTTGTGPDGKAFGKLTQRALWIESSLLGNVVVSESVAGFHGNPCTTTNGPPPPPPPPAAGRGWMTGGGRVNAAAKVTHGFRLECTKESGQNNLQVNWGNGEGFHLEQVTSAACSDSPSIDSGNPRAGFDTLVGEATGRCIGGGTATATYRMTDAGEPGTADQFTITINGACNLNASGTLMRGNHQAHGRP